MKVAGIIAEYNPFHKGHAYHIARTKELTGADFVIVVMSGDFVQRGEPAIIDKYSRTRMALQGGADLVLELPVCYATASAEAFAAGAVLLLESLGIVDYLSFGSEQGELSSLESLADIFLKEPEEYRSALRSYVKQGYSYPRARSLALGANRLPDTPNDILALEYCKALQKYHCPMKPVAIARKDAGYHDNRIRPGFCSAGAIREAMKHSVPEEALPDYSCKIIKESYARKQTPDPLCPIYLDDCRELLSYKMMEQMDCLREFEDITPALADRMIRLFSLSDTPSEYVSRIKNKSLTVTRIQRCLIHLLLDIKKKDLLQATDAGSVFYGRLLGFRDSARYLLRMIQKKGTIPVITKPADGCRQLAHMPPAAQTMWLQDLHASHVYQLLVLQKYGTRQPDEYHRSPEHMM